MLQVNSKYYISSVTERICKGLCKVHRKTRLRRAA